MLLGIDVGTTHCKAGLFETDGTVVKIATRPTLTRRAPEGFSYYEPEELWQTVAAAIREVTPGASGRPIAAVGIASMAETGLLVDRKAGAARSVVVPWFDSAAEPQADFINRQSDPLERFSCTGIRATFKCSLAKLLWLREREPNITEGAVWLCAADYVAYRLTGQLATDYSLAGRTYAFRIDDRRWDEEWLRGFGLDAELFPPARASGAPAGKIESEGCGLAPGTPVAVAGHDHVCAALAMGVIEPGRVLNSLGTAESLVGVLQEFKLAEQEFQSGLVFGCHAVEGQYYWMGGASSSGGSVEWLRGILGDLPLSYDELLALLERAKDMPTGILYYPYLLGNVPGRHGIHARAAFIGLAESHGRADVLKAVLEGTAYEMETVRRVAEAVTGLHIDCIMAAGGGTRLRPWLQIRADVSGCCLKVSPVSEATLLGAALCAGIGSGVYANAQEATAALAERISVVIQPDAERHQIYQNLYETQYLTFQTPLLRLSDPQRG